MIRAVSILVAAIGLAGCVATAPEPVAQAPALPPEVNVVSDYPPVRAAVLPRLLALGYVVAQDSQYWTILTKPGSVEGIGGIARPATRLTVTFASIRTHTRVIAEPQYLARTPEGEQAVPAPNHPDRALIQARLDEARQEVERRPLGERRGRPPPVAGPVPPMPGAPRATVAGRSAPPAAEPAAAAEPPAQPAGQTRVRL